MGVNQSAQDYYPFGMIMPDRNFTTSTYRFGFNGQEKDDEISGQTGSKLDFGARIYDARIGRWLSLDKEAAKGPGFSPYCFAMNNPILMKDPDGNWPEKVHHKILEKAFGYSLEMNLIKPEQYNALIKGSNNADSPLVGPGALGNQSDARQYIHGMKPSGMTDAEAIKAADDWIESNINEFVKTGDFEKLGEALHTIMDITCPSHRDQNGNPKAYNDPINHHNKETPRKIKANNGKNGYIKEKDMDERIDNAAITIKNKCDEALKKRDEYVKQEKKNKEETNTEIEQ